MSECSTDEPELEEGFLIGCDGMLVDSERLTIGVEIRVLAELVLHRGPE